MGAARCTRRSTTSTKAWWSCCCSTTQVGGRVGRGKKGWVELLLQHNSGGWAGRRLQVLVSSSCSPPSIQLLSSLHPAALLPSSSCSPPFIQLLSFLHPAALVPSSSCSPPHAQPHARPPAIHADPFLENGSGHTPLDLAVATNNVTLIRRLERSALYCGYVSCKVGGGGVGCVWGVGGGGACRVLLPSRSTFSP
jgi:hypothetical protein